MLSNKWHSKNPLEVHKARAITQTFIKREASKEVGVAVVEVVVLNT